MKKLIVTLLLATPVLAGEEMKKLDFLLGDWAGEATVRMGPGEPEKVFQTERIQPKLGGEIIVIEGLGKDAGGKTVHDALAILSWDPEKKHYRFSTYVAGRGTGETVLELTGPSSGIWRLEGPWGKQRYTIDVTEAGEWVEIGEFSRDGEKWVKFIEMRLKRK